MGYARCRFRDIETYLRIVVDLNEDDFQLILNQYNSTFVTFEINPGIYTIKGNSEAVQTMCDHDGTLHFEHNDFTMKRKLILTRFGGTFGSSRFNEIFFKYFIKFYNILGL